MKRLAICCVALSVALAGAAVAEEHDDWVELFDGETLEGWTQKNGTAAFEVKDGTILGTTAKNSPNSFLCTDEEFADFELQFEVMLYDNELNSGCQIRSKAEPPKAEGRQWGRVNGPQVEIEASGKWGAESGYLYGEACGGWMTPEDELIRTKAFRDGEWNHYRIMAKGPAIRTWVNKVPIEFLEDEEKYESHPKGFIGLQVHGVGDKGPYRVAWRNIRIRPLGPDDELK